MAEQRRVHKTVHHYLLEAVGGELSDADVEVVEVAWVPLDEVAARLAYADERRLATRALRAAQRWAGDGWARVRRPDPALRPAAARRPLLALVALLILLAAPLALPLGGRPAAADEGDATAVLDSLEPLVLAGDGTLRLTGRITAAAELSDVTVQLRASATPAANRSELGLLDGGDVPARREGNAVSGTSRVVADTLAKGDQAAFELDVPGARLPFRKAGAYPIAVEVRGTVGGDRGRVATVRTTVPWWPAGTRAAATPLAVVWPLIDEPRRDPEGVFTAEGADALAESLAPGGRLARLVQAADGAPAAWIVDPELLGAAFELSAGAVVRDGDTTTTRPADPDARAWIAAVSRAAKQPAAGGWLAVVPYADPDVAAVVRAGLSADLVTASARGAALGRLVLGVETPAAPGWPAGGAPEEALAAIAGAGTRTVLLDAALYPPRTPTNATPAGVAVLPPSAGTATALLGDPQLTAVSARDASAPGVLVSARQRLLAETLVITLERPSDPRPQVLIPPRRFAPTAEWAAQLLRVVRETPWTAPTALQSLAPAGSEDIPRRGPLYPPAAAAAEISPSQLDDIAAGQDQLAALDAILERPGPRSDAATAALLRGQSTAWRSEPAAGAAYAKATRASIKRAWRGVSILEPGR